METRILTTTFEGIEAVGAAVRVGQSGKAGDGRARTIVDRALEASGFGAVGRGRSTTVEPERPGNDELHGVPRALGVLATAGVLRREEIERTLCAGLLGPDGRLGWTRGLYPTAVFARENGLRLIAPAANAAEAEAAGAVGPVLADTLAELVDKLQAAASAGANEGPGADAAPSAPQAPNDGRRAIQLAAAGRHHAIMLSGLPVLRLVHELPDLWPEPTREEEADIRTIYSLARLKADSVVSDSLRPVRAPHHTASLPSLCGRTARDRETGTLGLTRPGELSLAHAGVLIADEIEEWSRAKLEALARAMSTGRTTASLHEAPARCLVIGIWSGRADGVDADDWPAERLGAAGERFQIACRLKGAESITDSPRRREARRRRQQVVRIASARQHARYGRAAYNGDVGADEFADRAAFSRSGIDALAATGGNSSGAVARVARTIADLDDRAFANADDVANARLHATRNQTPVERHEAEAAA